MRDTLDSRMSIYGRLADDLTRQALGARTFEARLASGGAVALSKSDGHFVFSGLPTAVSPYELTLSAHGYQSRKVDVLLPASDPVEVDLPGEDELYALITQVDSPQSQVRFDAIPFLVTIDAGTQVIGPGGFSSSLSAPLEGSGVQFAQLDSVTGLIPGNLLRFVRSPNLMMRPGPYYTFPPNTTLAVFRVAENVAGESPLEGATLEGESPLEGATLEIDQINDQALDTSNVDGLDLHTVTLPGPPPIVLVLGTDAALHTRTDARGYGIFYFPEGWPVNRLQVQVTRIGHVAATLTVDLTANARTFQGVHLNRA